MSEYRGSSMPVLRLSHGGGYSGSMISRYQDGRVAQIWLETVKLRMWTNIELRHLELLGYEVPDPRSVVPSEDLVRLRELEAGHDVGGFLLALEETLGYDDWRDCQRWLHYGLTSSDLVDTTNALRVNVTTRVLDSRFDRLISLLRAEKFNQPINGRTHGQVASPTSLWHRWYSALHGLGVGVSVPGMFSGAVGRHSVVSATHASNLCRALGLDWCRATTQVLPRRHFVQAIRCWVDWLTACEQIALDVRLMSMTGDVSEPTRAVGSSTMPGKTNPIRAERICGLARDARARLHALEEGQSLWLDRDLSHSAVDRLEFEDIAHLVGFGLMETATLLETLDVHPQPVSDDGGPAVAEALLAEHVRNYDQPRSASYEQARRLIAETPRQQDTTPDPAPPGTPSEAEPQEEAQQ